MSKQSNRFQDIIQQVGSQMLNNVFAEDYINVASSRRQYPNRLKIEMFSASLVGGFFPLFREECGVTNAEILARIHSLLAFIANELPPEINKALTVARNPETAQPLDLTDHERKERTEQITDQLIKALPKIHASLITDVKAAMTGDPAADSEQGIVLSYPFIPAMATYRVAHELHIMGVPLIPRQMTECGKLLSCGLEINPGAVIGDFFFCDHCQGTVIGDTAVIGDCVRLYQGVGLVAKSLSLSLIPELRKPGVKRHPTIESHVTIYANATIVGDITVGRGSTIGGNVNLMASVPPNSIVLATDTPLNIINKDNRERLDPNPSAVGKTLHLAQPGKMINFPDLNKK